MRTYGRTTYASYLFTHSRHSTSVATLPEEQYDEATFTEEHKAFKESHNDAFVALS